MPITLEMEAKMDVSNAQRGVDQLGNDVNRLGTGMQNAGGAAHGMGGGLNAGTVAMGLAAGAAGAAVIGIGAIGVSSVQVAAEFETGMSAIKAATGATGQELDSLRGLALDLGMANDVGAVSAKDAADAIFELSKAGVGVGDQLGGATKAALQLAAAAGPEFGIANAATLAADAMNSFGLSGADSVNIANTLVGAANASSIGLSELKFSLSSVGAVANTVGLSLEDTATAIAVLGQNGIKGSDAGTSLKTMLMNLQPASEKQQDIFRNLGITTLDVGKAMAAAAEGGVAITQTTQGWTVSGKEFRDEANAVRQALFEMDGGTGDWTDATEKQMAALNNMTRATQFQNNAFFTSNGEIRSMAEISAVLHEKLAGLTDAERLMALETMFGSDAVRAAAIFYEQGAEGVAKMAGQMAIQGDAAAAAATMSDNLQGKWAALQGTIETLQIQIGSALLPVLSDLVTGFTNLLGSAEVQAVMEGIGTAFNLAGTAVTSLMGILPSIVPSFDEVGSSTSGLTELITSFGGIATTIFTTAQTTFDTFRQIAVGVFTNVKEALEVSVLPALDRLAGFLAEALPPAIATLSGFWTGVLLPAIQSVWSFISDTVIPVAGVLVGWLIDQIPAALSFLGSAWTTVLWPQIERVWSAIQANVFPLFSELFTWLQQTIPVALSTAASFWTTTLAPALSQVWSFLSANVIPILGDVAVWLIEQIPVAVGLAADAWNTVLQPALSVIWEFLSTSLIPTIADLFNWLSVNIPPAIQALASFWSNTLQPALSNVWDFLSGSLIPTLSNLVSIGINPVNAAARTLASFWNGTLKPAIDAVADAIGRVMGFLGDLGDALSNIELPDWMTPGSPTPWEIGLVGVADAMSQLSRNELPTLSREMDALNPPNIGLDGKTGEPAFGQTTTGGTTLTSTTAPIGNLTIVLVQDRKGNWRLDQQSEAQALQVRLETREVF